MALTTVRYGRYKTASEADFGEQTAGQMRASVYDAATDTIWVTKIGGWVGKNTGTNATVRWSVYETDGSMNPSDQVGYSEAATVSTSMTGSGAGASYAPDVDGDPFLIESGHRYAIAQLPTGAGIGHSMRQASAITADNEQFYSRTGLSQPPPDPFGAYTASVQGHLTAWAEGYVNEAPIAPNNRAPYDSINETAPTFEGDFRDLNGGYGTSSGDGVDTGDYCTQYQIQLREVGTTSLLWNSTYNTTSTEKSTDHLERAYGGSTLTRGDTYEWRIRTKDRAGAWGDYSSWLEFTPANLGFVTLDADPTGKIEETTPDFDGKWTHQSATSMATVQVRILTPGGTVLQTGANYNIADVSSSAAPGTAFTVAWADAGLSELAWGTSYRYQIRGYDGSQWSDWSASRSFSTNAAPSIPSSLSPANGLIFTAFPLLAFSMSDADDTTGTGLTATIRITRPDTGTVDVAPTYNATTLKWEFQTTGTELDEYGVFSWEAIGYDGTLYSGEATSIGDGTWSASNTFTYALGPTVTIDEPDTSDTITSASFDVTWTTTDQVKYKVAVYDTGTTDVVYQSNSGAWTVSADDHHTVPSGYVRNGATVDVTVETEDTTPLTGSDTNTAILIDYTPPADVANFQVNPTTSGTRLRATWDASEVDSEAFIEQTISRYADGGPDAAELIVDRITDQSITSWTDDHPASGYEYTYVHRVVVQEGLDRLESAGVEATSSVTLTSTVLSLVGNAETYRVFLTNVRERADDRMIDEAVYRPLSQTLPTTVRGRTRFYVASITAALIDTDDTTAAQHKAALEDVDAQDGVLCMRYADGTKRFIKIANLAIQWEHGGHYTAKFTARQERYTEGVA